MVPALGRDFQITDLESYQDMSICISKRSFHFYWYVPLVALQFHFIGYGYSIGMMIADGSTKWPKPVVPDRTFLFFMQLTIIGVQ
jgi:hypothetical protein